MSSPDNGSLGGERMNRSQYAKRIGVSRQHVSKLVEKKKIPIDHNGLIDPLAADAALASVADPSKRAVIEANNARYGTRRNPLIASEVQISKAEREVLASLPPVNAPQKESTPQSFAAVKTAREQTLHEINQFELAVLQGKYISRDDAAKLAFESARSWRGQIVKVQITLPTVIEGLIRKHLAEVDVDRVRKLKHEIGLAVNDAHRSALDVVASEVEALGESLAAAQS